MEPMEKDADKDIKNYVLPRSKKTVSVKSEDGTIYKFELERPTAGARDKLMVDHNMITTKEHDLTGQEVVSYNQALIKLVCKRGAIEFPDGKGNEMVLDDSLDGVLFDILVAQCSNMLGIGERDKYFRAEGSKQ